MIRNEPHDQHGEIINTDLEASVDGVGRQPSFFRADFPLVEELRDPINSTFEVKIASAPTCF